MKKTVLLLEKASIILAVSDQALHRLLADEMESHAAIMEVELQSAHTSKRKDNESGEV